MGIIRKGSFEKDPRRIFVAGACERLPREITCKDREGETNTVVTR